MFYFKDNKQLTVYFADGNAAVWQAGNPQFDKVLELCKSSNWVQVEMLHNQAKVLLNNKVTIQGDTLTVEVSKTMEVDTFSMFFLGQTDSA